jgi:hypothetical protein
MQTDQMPTDDDLEGSSPDRVLGLLCSEISLYWPWLQIRCLGPYP